MLKFLMIIFSGLRLFVNSAGAEEVKLNEDLTIY